MYTVKPLVNRFARAWAILTGRAPIVKSTHTSNGPTAASKPNLLLTRKQTRALTLMMTEPASGAALSAVTGYSRGRRVITQLRKLGLELPCRIGWDFDGQKICRFGRYSLSPSDRLKIRIHKPQMGISGTTEEGDHGI